MSERFFLAAAPRDGHAILAGDEARHLARVLRAKVGDEVRLFDGSGAEWPARVARIGRDEVLLDVATALPHIGSAGSTLTLAVALPKGDRQKWMVEKLTELGVARLVPLVTARGVAEATDSARARLERGVIEACKQCGRNTLMEIGAAATLESLATPLPPGTLRLIAHPGGMPLDAASVPPQDAVVAVVGPEGGFALEEIAVAERHGFKPVSLGPHILRIETAALALAARFVSTDHRSHR
jgi:16S rRNA (uracil1498-N3)-methyltransferase